MTSSSGPDVEADLRRQLALATASAQSAYRDSARLIRLLTILGQPGTPEDLVDEALTTLSEVFQADITSLVRLVDGRLLVTASCGLPEDDAAFVTGWVPSPQAAGVLAGGQAASSSLEADAQDDARDAAGAPDHTADDALAAGEATAGPFAELSVLRDLGIRSAAWLPLPDEDGLVHHLLVLYRRNPHALTSSEMALLGSVALRLRISVQARRRAAALELLARSGHVLPQHRHVEPLLDDASRLLRELVSADAAVAYAIADGQARRVAPHDTESAADPPELALLTGPTWPGDDVPPEALPGWTSRSGDRPQLIEVDRVTDVGATRRRVLMLPAGPSGAPEAVLYAGWTDLPPLMSSAVETAAIFGIHLSSALATGSLYRALSQSEASLRLITDAISDLVSVVDPGCRFVYASASYARAAAHEPDALVGRSVLDLVDPDDRVRLRDAILTAAASSASVAVEYRFRAGDGTAAWVESVIRPAEGAAAALSGGPDGPEGPEGPAKPDDASAPERLVVMSTRLIDDRRRREEELRRLAAHDPLTGLVNRSAVTRRLDEALASEASGDVGVLFCDLNKFKQVNDRLGHAAGDDLLQQVADRLRRSARSGDVIARLGGDEFVFVLDGVTGVEEVAEVGRRVAAALEPPFLVAGEQLSMSASVGAALGRRCRASATEILNKADLAMYAAKAGGTRPTAQTVALIGG